MIMAASVLLSATVLAACRTEATSRAETEPIAPAAVPATEGRPLSGDPNAWSLEDLERGIEDPDVAVDYDHYVARLVRLRDAQARQPYGRDSFGAYVLLRPEENEEFARRLLAALPEKRGAARLATIETLWRFRQVGVPAVRDAVIANWTDLRRELRTALLLGSWEALRDPRFEPLLAADMCVPTGADGRNVYWHVDDDLASLALLHYAEFQPAAARAIILEDIRRPNPLYTGIVLASLPDAHLDEVDAHFQGDPEEIRRTQDMFKQAKLLERYGGPAVMKNALALLESEGWACEIQAGLLGYVMRFDRSNGLALVERAARRRKTTGCYRAVFADVLPKYWGSDARTLVEKFRDDPDAQVRREVEDLLLRPDLAK
jgi:hypothetical protein